MLWYEWVSGWLSLRRHDKGDKATTGPTKGEQQRSEAIGSTHASAQVPAVVGGEHSGGGPWGAVGARAKQGWQRESHFVGRARTKSLFCPVAQIGLHAVPRSSNRVASLHGMPLCRDPLLTLGLPPAPFEPLPSLPMQSGGMPCAGWPKCPNAKIPRVPPEGGVRTRPSMKRAVS